MTLADRVARLAAGQRGEMTIVTVCNALDTKRLYEHAQAGERSWTRGEDEDIEAFKERVLADARQMGATFLYFLTITE